MSYDEEIHFDDEIASLHASMRAVSHLLEKYKLDGEFEELRLQYLPEELQKRREWWKKVCAEKKVKVTTEGK